MENELVSGLRNAIARGSSLEESVRSLINAGYNAEEVKAASQKIDNLSDDIPELPSIENPDLEKKLPPLPSIKKTPELEKRGGGRRALIIVLSIVLVAALGALGYLIYNILQ